MGDVIMGQKPDGKFSNVQLNSLGQVLTSPTGTVAIKPETDAVPIKGRVTISGRAATEEDTWSGATIITNSTGEPLLATPKTGARAYLSDLLVSNENTSGVLVRVRSGGTSLTEFFLVPAGQTLVLNLNTPVRGALSDALRVQAFAGYPASIRVTGSGYYA